MPLALILRDGKENWRGRVLSGRYPVGGYRRAGLACAV